MEGPAVGGSAAGVPPPAAPPPAEPASVRLQFGGRQRLGGCVAWDRASGLLAVELEAEQGSGDAAAVAILDPQAPESHFLAAVPAGAGAEPGGGLAALLWSPPAARRLLLAVAASGAVTCWTMDEPPAPPAPPAAQNGALAAEAKAQGGSKGGRAGAAGPHAAGGSHAHTAVPCVNGWFGRPALQLPLPPAAAGGQPRLAACRLLGAPALAACCDLSAAPPLLGSDAPQTVDQVVPHYQQRGLDSAFASTAAVAPPAASAQPPAPHWLRPGLLCLAAVTSSGQLLLAVGGLGGSWAVAPAVQLPLPAPPPSALAVDDFGPGAAQQRQQLVAADVAPTPGGGLLVAAAAAAGPPPPGEQQHQLLLWEVAGPPPPLLAGGGAQQQQRQQQVSRLSPPEAALPPRGAALCLAFAPGTGAGGAMRLLLASAAGDTTSASLLSCTAGASSSGGLHTWQVQAGPSTALDSPRAEAAAAVAAGPDAGSLALLLPGAQRLLSLRVGGTRELQHARPQAPAPLPHVALARGSRAAPGLSVSPNGVLAAVASAGGSALLLLPLLQQPAHAAAAEEAALELGKRCCLALLAGTAAGAAAWDLAAAAAALSRRWGHSQLLATQALADAAVAGSRPDARPQLAAAWARLKASLLAAAAAAHPAAAADGLAAAVRADVAAREWMALAADVFEAHMPDRATRAAANAPGPLAPEARAALVRMMPARYWAAWSADFSCFLARCLLLWLRRKKSGAGGKRPQPAGGGVDAAAEAFAADQSAEEDSLPCIRLLADSEFYRTFSRLVGATHQFAGLLSSMQRGRASRTADMMTAQLTLVSDVVVLLRTLYDAFTKAQAEGGAGGGRLGGAWTLPCAAPSRPLDAAAVSGALQRVKQQAAGGSSALLERVRERWSQLPQKVDTPGTLLEAATQLGLLPPQQAAPAGGEGGAGAPAASLGGLLRQRRVALVAAEAGEAVGGGAPLLAPLPALPTSALEGLPADGLARSAAAAAADAAAARERQQQEAAWEEERDAALGLPPPPPDEVTQFQGCIDVLTGRQMCWELGVSYAAADGSAATSEPLPGACAPGSAHGWQAAYAAAVPVGGQRWKRLRVA